MPHGLSTIHNDKARWMLYRMPWPLQELTWINRGRNYTDLFQRSVIAVSGGVSLLVPVIIMTFTTSRAARLIVVSVTVLLFSLFMAVGTPATNENLLTATAAYAAVMVVYVGTALPSSD
ncbi:hypothetical protein LTR85_004459 [Meristemomyces frigidus]|nr:hypothetical protein LTR85_004459 [Meristemomyces frigidus]